MHTPLIAQTDLSRLVIVDVQSRLVDAMPTDAASAVIKNIGILIQAARILELPLLYTEQYPKGLGTTIPEISTLLDGIAAIEKTAFSCANVPNFNRQITSDRPQIILTGMETHICILQTALQLHQQGKQVFVVEDATLSRTSANKHNGLQRMRDAGIIITTTESVVFEWLNASTHEHFKKISQLII